MFNGIAIPRSLEASARDPLPTGNSGVRDIGAFVRVGNFRLDVPGSKIFFDENALKLHGSDLARREFGIGEWIALYHVEDRGPLLKLIRRATMLLRGFRFQARPMGDREPTSMVECYARIEGTSFHGIFLSSRSYYADVE